MIGSIINYYYYYTKEMTLKMKSSCPSFESGIIIINGQKIGLYFDASI